MASRSSKTVQRPGVRFRVQDEKAVDGTGIPVCRHRACAFQRQAVFFDAAQGPSAAGPAAPNRVRNAGRMVGVAARDEQQVGEAVQIRRHYRDDALNTTQCGHTPLGAPAHRPGYVQCCRRGAARGKDEVPEFWQLRLDGIDSCFELKQLVLIQPGQAAAAAGAIGSHEFAAHNEQACLDGLKQTIYFSRQPDCQGRTDRRVALVHRADRFHARVIFAQATPSPYARLPRVPFACIELHREVRSFR